MARRPERHDCAPTAGGEVIVVKFARLGAYVVFALIVITVLCRSHWVEIRICPKADYERGCEMRKVP